MNKNNIITELTTLYKKFLEGDDLKSAVNTLKFLAQLQGFYTKAKELCLQELSDADLDFLIQKLESQFYAS